MKKINRRLFIIAGLVITIVSALSISIYFIMNQRPSVTFAGGQIDHDTTWSGFISVQDNVNILAGVKLTILPGTFIEFKHYRGYKDYDTVAIMTNGGTIEAIGTTEQMITFTSDAENPINGDWGGISLQNSNESIFKYVIVEFAIIGIEQYDSSVDISHSIIRWVNTEGLYTERSDPIVEYNIIYGNGYHDIALEQYNYDAIIRYNLFKGGHSSIHAESSNVTITQNYFLDYIGAITGGQFSHMIITDNVFDNITDYEWSFDFTVVPTLSGNNVDGNGTATIPVLDIEDIGSGRLGYIPGDPEDQYLYVYDTIDETRQVLRRLTNVTLFGWSIAYANESIWRFNHGSKTVGVQQDFVRIDPDTQTKKFYGNNLLVNPRALCYDGSYFWTYDFTFHKLYKFTVNDTWIVFLDSISVAGITGLTSDGTYLYSPSDGLKINKYDMTGTLIETIPLTGGSVAFVGITWTGNYFWTDSGNKISKWYPNGTLAGMIYAAALETTDLTWDGTHLWTIQKTCELWEDGKIFEIEIIDDQFLL